MTRVVSWPEVLAAELATARRKPFDWNGWSCFDFCAQVVLALTGVDHRDKFPQYATQAEAEVVLAAKGGVIGILTEALGEPRATPAQRGDIVAIDFGNGIQPAVCTGLASFAPGARGLMALPTARAVAAWSV